MTKPIEVEPSSFEDATKHKEWRNAMQEEYKSVMKNDVSKIVPRPSDKCIVTLKWIYTINYVVDGSIDK